MTDNPQQLPLPGSELGRLATAKWSGRMPRWATQTATIASFAAQNVGLQQEIYVPLATAALAGAQSAADKTKSDALGSVISHVRGANLAVLAATVTTIDTITLTAGKWLVIGWIDALTGAAAGNIDAYLDVSSIGTPTVYLVAAQNTTVLTAPALVTVASGTQVVNLKAFANVAFTAASAGGAAGFANETGLAAFRIG